MDFIIKRFGSSIGGMPFNSQTSSCDVLDKKGRSCCVDPKEARKNNMRYCGPPVSSTERKRPPVILKRKK